MTDAPTSGTSTPGEAFRFLDHRLNYLKFILACNEKDVAAARIIREFSGLAPGADVLRLFDAGTGDGTVLADVLRGMHKYHPGKALHVVGKEYSGEDVRLVLGKMADRFAEHRNTTLILTNRPYETAPWTTPPFLGSPQGDVEWMPLALEGETSFEFGQQISTLEPFVSENWSRKSGKKSAIIIHHKDFEALQKRLSPANENNVGVFDGVIAVQPYQLGRDLEFKATKIFKPLLNSVAPRGKLILISTALSAGDNPGHELIREFWPADNPMRYPGPEILAAAMRELAEDRRSQFTISDPELLRHELRALTDGSLIGTDVLDAAWHAATYVFQIINTSIPYAMQNDQHLATTKDILAKYSGKLWFYDHVTVAARNFG